jgi:hypothetical protein
MLLYAAVFHGVGTGGTGVDSSGNSHVNLAVVMAYKVFLPTTPGGETATSRPQVNQENPIGEHQKFPDQNSSEIDVDRIAAEGKYTFCHE